MSWNTIKFELKATIVKDDSAQASEGGYISGNHVRPWRGRMQTVGGTEKYSASQFTGIARGALGWSNTLEQKLMAFGTQGNFYTHDGSSLRDIYPFLTRMRLGEDPIETEATSTTVIVNHAGHGLLAGESVTISQCADVGGLTINGTWTVAEVIGPNQWSFTHGSAAGSSATGGSTDGNNAGFRLDPYVSAALAAGPVDQSSSALPRIWSIAQYGESFVTCPNGRKLFLGHITQGGATNIITNGTFTSDLSGWSSSGGWSQNTSRAILRRSINGAGTPSGAANNTDFNLSQTIASSIPGGRYCVFSFDAWHDLIGLSTATEVTVSINCGSPPALVELMAFDPTSTQTTYPITFIMPSMPIDIVITGNVDATANNTSAELRIDNVDLRVIELAPLSNAPGYNTGCFTDANRIVIVYGTVETDGDYNPMCVRWCDQENINVWISDTDNLAGEYILGKGSRIVAGLAARQENLIFTDTTLHSMRFTGSADSVYAFDEIATGGMPIAQHAVASYNGLTAWMSSDSNFYAYSGGVPTPLDCPMRDDVFDNLNTAQAAKVWLWVNTAFNEFWWFYPRGAATECSHYVAWNWKDDGWHEGEWARTSGLSKGLFDYPKCFGADRYIWDHERGHEDNGATMTWHVESAYTDIEDGHNLMAVSDYWVDAGYQTGDIKVTFSFRDTSRSTALTQGPFTIADDATGPVRMRGMGRQMKIRWGNGTDNEGWRDGVKNLTVQKTGARR